MTPPGQGHSVDRPDLVPLEIGPRRHRVSADIAEVRCDALLVTNLTNIRWLTGFSGSAARLVVRDEEMVLVTDGRYGDQAVEQLAAHGVEARVEVGRSQDAQRTILTAQLRRCPRIGLEAAQVSWADQQAYARLFPEAELVATNGLVERHRVLKDAGEVARIELAAAIASEALASVFDLLDREPTEADFALALDSEMRRLGAQGPSFATIVASGPNSGLPHHEPGNRHIVEGDLVVIDYGALVDGYHSDMTRTAMLGEPTAQQAELLEVVTLAQAAGVATVRAGVAAIEVDSACRSAIEAAGLGDRFTHGTGHGVGLVIHEAPWLNATSADVLEAGAVITVEPGVYLVGSGGVRVEDALLVTDDGCRPLTLTPKDLSCLRSAPTNSRTG